MELNILPKGDYNSSYTATLQTLEMGGKTQLIENSQGITSKVIVRGSGGYIVGMQG